MRLSCLTCVFLGLTTFSSSASGTYSNLPLFGAPRHNLDGVLPVLDIEEQYIYSQTEGSSKAFDSTHLQCSASDPCPDGSCCNSQGQCGYRNEHCKSSCVANCNAKAPCGVNSIDGQQLCPLNVCCSHFGFCGVSEAFCRDTTESGLRTPCQRGFGKCGTIRTQAIPTCGKDSGTATRKIAYYESWNTRRRPCDKVWPSNIETSGLTHLIFSFATINPATFVVEPMHPDDEKLYADFLALKDGSQKWIGIGGWEFSDAGPTHYTWSQMASSKTNRDVFIASLLRFLEKWDFGGIDIDWEWPGAESRGGNPAVDKQNQVYLIEELREALGSRGLSVVLPAQYEYLKNLDPNALESKIDFFSLLAYDLHGPWDATIPGLGPLVKPHTNLQEIGTALDLLRFNDIPPVKINLGVANYGRGYLLADTTCARFGCTWTGPSKAGKCTELAGVLSQCEIQRIISQKQLKPELINDTGVKQIVFDGQWIGYDDNETLGLKRELANDRCLGGTALWAIDYASCGSSSGGGPGGPSASHSRSTAPLSSIPVLISSAIASSVLVEPTASVTSSAPASSAPDGPTSMTCTKFVAPSRKSPSKTAKYSTTYLASKSTTMLWSSTTSSAWTPARSSQAVPSISPVIPSGESLIGSLETISVVTTAILPLKSSASGSSAPVASPNPVSSSVSVTEGWSSKYSSAWTSKKSSQYASSVLYTTFSGTSHIGITKAPPAESVYTRSVLSSTLESSNLRSSDLSFSATASYSINVSVSWSSWAWSTDLAVISSIASGSETSVASSGISSSQISFTTSSAMVSTSYVTHDNSRVSIVTLSQVPLSENPPVVVVPSPGFSQSSTATTSIEAIPSSLETSSSFATSQETSATGWISLSDRFAWNTLVATTSASAASETWSTSLFSMQSTSTETSPSDSFSIWPSKPGDTMSATYPADSITSGISFEASLSALATGTGLTSAWASNPATSSLGTPKNSQPSFTDLPLTTPSSDAQSGTFFPATSSGPSSVLSLNDPEISSYFFGSQWTISSVMSPEFSTLELGSSDALTSDAISTVPGLVVSNISGSSWRVPTQVHLSTTFGSITSEMLPYFRGSSISSAAISTGTQRGNSIIIPRPIPTTKSSQKHYQDRTWTETRTTTDDTGKIIVTIITKKPGDDDKPGKSDSRGNFPPSKTMNRGQTTSGDDENNIMTSSSAKWNLSPGASAKPTDLPPSSGLEKGCVPNDCVAECIPWYALSLLVIKRPFCPCVPRTCKPDDHEDDWSDSDSDGQDDDCSMFGCGCGWMGLPWGGPKCKLKFPLPDLFPSGLFGPRPCLFFGSCPPNNGDNLDPCGPFGCDGYCNTEKGCDPCPPEICGGPKCTIPAGCGPKPGPNPSPNPTRLNRCEKEQQTTITEMLVFCTENINLEPTTIASINFTLSTTLTSTCLTPILYTQTGCGLLGTKTTTTISSFMTTSSEVPVCSRAPLDLSNDEGDNEQPPRITDGLICSRSPLSLDDDEGDNEQPISSRPPACTRAPLSLDDDEGNNEMPSDMLSSLLSNSSIFSSKPSPTSNYSGSAPRTSIFLPSVSANSSRFSSKPSLTSNYSRSGSYISVLLTSVSANSSSLLSSTIMSIASSSTKPSSSMPWQALPSSLSDSTAPPWGPFGTTRPYCPTCDMVFSDCIKDSCKQDGSDALECAKFCLSDLCYGQHNADYCKKGPCKPAACPKENPTNFFKGEPAIPFTTVLSLSGTTLSVTASPTYSALSSSRSPTPTCDPGHTIASDGKWTALVEHEIRRRPDNATLSWILWDEHGCKAGEGLGWNQFLGHNISTDIGAPSRTQDHRMGYMLHTNVTSSLSTTDSEIEFLISKPVGSCKELCWVKWKISSREKGKSWQITDDCARQCGSPKLGVTDISCDDGMNKWHDPGDSSIQKRGGYCTWRMPFKPANDDAPSPPKPWTRDSRWTVELLQSMEYEASSIEWWLTDPNGNSAGHLWKDTSQTDKAMSLIEARDRGGHPELQMRYKMLLTVFEPRNKDITQVRLTYQNDNNPHCKYSQGMLGMVPECRPYYETESSDETRQSRLENCYTGLGGTKFVCPTPMIKDKIEFSCDKVYDSFYPKDAGFERKFKCWWPHDFVDPYGKTGQSSEMAGTVDLSGMNGASLAA